MFARTVPNFSKSVAACTISAKYQSPQGGLVKQVKARVGKIRNLLCHLRKWRKRGKKKNSHPLDLPLLAGDDTDLEEDAAQPNAPSATSANSPSGNLVVKNSEGVNSAMLPHPPRSTTTPGVQTAFTAKSSVDALKARFQSGAGCSSLLEIDDLQDRMLFLDDARAFARGLNTAVKGIDNKHYFQGVLDDVPHCLVKTSSSAPLHRIRVPGDEKKIDIHISEVSDDTKLSEKMKP